MYVLETINRVNLFRSFIETKHVYSVCSQDHKSRQCVLIFYREKHVYPVCSQKHLYPVCSQKHVCNTDVKKIKKFLFWASKRYILHEIPETTGI